MNIINFTKIQDNLYRIRMEKEGKGQLIAAIGFHNNPKLCDP
jgi:hypothetical protein